MLCLTHHIRREIKTFLRPESDGDLSRDVKELNFAIIVSGVSESADRGSMPLHFLNGCLRMTGLERGDQWLLRREKYSKNERWFFCPDNWRATRLVGRAGQVSPSCQNFWWYRRIHCWNRWKALIGDGESPGEALQDPHRVTQVAARNFNSRRSERLARRLKNRK